MGGAPLQAIHEVGLGGGGRKGPGATSRSGRMCCSAFFSDTHWMVIWLPEWGAECRRRCFHRQGHSDRGHASGYHWWLGHYAVPPLLLSFMSWGYIMCSDVCGSRPRPVLCWAVAGWPCLGSVSASPPCRLLARPCLTTAVCALVVALVLCVVSGCVPETAVSGLESIKAKISELNLGEAVVNVDAGSMDAQQSVDGTTHHPQYTTAWWAW